MVDFLSTYSNRPDLLHDLAEATCQLDRAVQSTEPDESTSVRTLAPAYRKHYVAERLGEMVIKTIIEDFEAGTARHLLADRHGISVRTVGRLLKRHRDRESNSGTNRP